MGMLMKVLVRGKMRKVIIYICNCVLLLMGMFWTLWLSTGGKHNLTTGDIREIASGMWPNYKICCITACE